MGKTEGVECSSCWTPFIGACARMTHNTHKSAGVWVASHFENKQKSFLPEMKMWMKLLANEVHTQGMTLSISD